MSVDSVADAAITKPFDEAAADEMRAIFEASVARFLHVLPNADGALLQIDARPCLIIRFGGELVARPIALRATRCEGGGRQSMRPDGPLIVADVDRAADIDAACYRAAGIRSLICVPLTRGAATFGFLRFFAGRLHAFDARDLTVAELVAGRIGSHVSGTIGDGQQVNGPDDRFRSIVEALPQLVWTMTTDGAITYCNASATALLPVHFSRGGSDFRSILAREDRARVTRLWPGLQARPTPQTIDCRILPRSGPPRWQRLDLLPIARCIEGASGWIVAANCIETAKAHEATLQSAIVTRDLRLREVNHRVMNSLQTVAGLMMLQAARITDDHARDRLLSSREQVLTIAHVHRAVSRGSSQDQLDFRTLLSDVVDSLLGGRWADHRDLVFDVASDLVLPLDQAVSLALVVAEILANALKHAKPDGRLRIEIATRRNAGRLILEIADNGGGLSRRPVETSGGLGMDLIFGLSEQAGGSIDLVPDSRGTRFRFVATLP